MKTIKRLLLVLVVLTALALLLLRVRYGGGKPYPDVSSSPVLVGKSKLETVLEYPEPIGNVAATNDTSLRQRLFFTVHPESRPTGSKLLEVVNGKAVPYPSERVQTRFNTPLGVFCDAMKRLWVLDHGNHGAGEVRLTGYDLTADTVLREITFSKEFAPLGSFFNDLSVSPDGRYIAIADASFWRKKPCIVLVDLFAGRLRTLLEGHPSVMSEGFVPVTDIRKMRFFCVADLMPGLDGIDIDPTGQWIYFAGLSNSGLYRIPMSKAIAFGNTWAEVANSVERVADKPLSDGIRADSSQRVLVTDIEHHGVYLYSAYSRVNKSLIKDERIRWADGLSRGTGGYWYLADSALPDVVLQTKSHIREKGPYFIYRFQYW